MAELYERTDGPNWTDNSGWLSGSPLGEWHGVETDAGGNVIGLELAVNGLSGRLPEGLARLSNLESLVLVGNRLSGEIPSEIGNLAELRTLGLQGNRLSGEIPPELGNLAALKRLALGDNRLSGEIPTELGNLAALEDLWLQGNRLTGQIPPELGKLAALKRLGIQDNRIGGEIPSELGQLNDLEVLRLGWCGLSGRIPPELGGLSKLADLQLQANRLSGQIPPELGNLANLVTLKLGHNRLSGQIPPELGNLGSLEALELKWNRLSGQIPPGLLALPDLADLRLAGNDLDGPIPPDMRLDPPARTEAAGTWSESPGIRPEITLVSTFDGRVFERPVELGEYPVGPGGGGPGLFVAENDGLLLLLRPDSDEAVELLDIRDRVSRVGPEEGLLSVALDPRFEENGHLWLYYTTEGPPPVSRLSRFAADPDDFTRVDPGSELTVLEFGQLNEVHHGGAIRFGPDGMLYLGLGDNQLREEAQRLESVWGSVIRIDVSASSEASPYEIPPDNPFVNIPIARSEIWAYGFRNPWRMAFDPETEALWLGDVGNEEIEEIDRVEAGGNYGWHRFEGTRCTNPDAACDQYGFEPPLATYQNRLGCAVVGGVVYRGRNVPALVGHYVFSDHCGGQIWALPPDSGDAIELAQVPRRVSSLGLDAQGEIYVLTFRGSVLRVGPDEG